MHTDLNEKIISRRLHTLADGSSDAPYDWAEFKRRRSVRSTAPTLIARNRPAALGLAAVAAVLVLAVALGHLSHRHVPASAPTFAPADIASQVSDGTEQVARSDESSGTQTRTRAIEGWLADLPRDQAVVRVGAHAAVASLQDQIAALDDLMSAERVAGAKQSRLDALELQRAQLVSSLAQLRYAEMLASASP